MSKEYTVLATSYLTPEQCLADYVYLPKIVHMDDPAIDSMLDFRVTQPLIVQTSMHLPDARKALEEGRQSIILIFDASHHLAGLLSLEQILSHHTVSLIEEYRVSRKDLLVKHVMMPLANVAAVEISKLKHAKVGHVVATLQQLKAYYLLVYEADAVSGKDLVRGIFLTYNISKLLGKRISFDPLQSNSLAELQRKLHK